MSAELLAGIAGAALSLLFSYAPGCREWFERLPGERKRLVMLGLLALAAVGVFGLSCLGWAGALGLPELACSQGGVLVLARLLLAAVMANQSAFLIAPSRLRRVRAGFQGEREDNAQGR
ncbi:MAG TPA: hypothetical protein VF498_06430 [Anaerolineales bacterium]